MKGLLFLLAACGGTPATVETPTLPTGSATIAPPTEVAWSELDGNIKTVTVKSEDQTQVASVKQWLAAEIGKPLDRRRLRGELSSIVGSKGIADATATAIQLADGVELVITVKPQPALHALTAHEAGGKDIPLPGLLATAAGLPLDPALLDKVVNELRSDYLAKGFTAVSATWKQTDTAARQVDVAIEVTPGKPSTVTSVGMKGNKKVKQADLVKLVTIAPNSPFVSDAMDNAVLALTTYYYDHGFINITVTAPAPTGGAAVATFAITEGDQFRLGKLEVTGVPPEDAKKYLAMLAIKKGDVFSRSAVQKGIEKIQAAVAKEVDPITHLDIVKKTIDLELAVPKSP
ncbi:MAG TPA: POTRA domain-containing protein [Kofleriaceae bacterium]